MKIIDNVEKPVETLFSELKNGDVFYKRYDGISREKSFYMKLSGEFCGSNNSDTWFNAVCLSTGELTSFLDAKYVYKTDARFVIEKIGEYMT